jgi:hypothetical protein
VKISIEVVILKFKTCNNDFKNPSSIRFSRHLDKMGQATSHNHHGSSGSNPQYGDRPRSTGGSGVNFGAQQGQWPHVGGADILKDVSPFDGQVNHGQTLA